MPTDDRKEFWAMVQFRHLIAATVLATSFMAQVALGQAPEPVQHLPTTPPPVQETAAGCATPGGCNEGCSTCDSSGFGVGYRGGLFGYFHSTCDMPQHHPYFPPMHGYYYFRPYHPSHVRWQQEFVASYGGDRRNPYSNDIFKVVYAEFAATQGEVTQEPATSPGSPVLPTPLVPSTPRRPLNVLPQQVPEVIPAPRALAPAQPR